MPRDAGLQALRDLRALVDRSDWRIGFPVEVRTSPADGIPLSPASDHDTLYLAVTPTPRPTTAATSARWRTSCVRYGGRPHWGKLHSRTAGDLEPPTPAGGTSR